MRCNCVLRLHYVCFPCATSSPIVVLTELARVHAQRAAVTHAMLGPLIALINPADPLPRAVGKKTKLRLVMNSDGNSPYAFNVAVSG